MKNQKKKGTAPRRKQHPNTNHKSYSNRIENICLVFAVTFLILFIGGNLLNNEPMTFLGAGIGFAGMVIQLDINFSEEDDDIWEE